jgi:hypothetical protein
VQAAVVENLNLYTDKYEEEFQKHLSMFTQVQSIDSTAVY